MATEQARRILAYVDAPPVTNPFAALWRLGGLAEQWRETCAYLVNKIGEEELRFAGQVGGLKAEQLRSEVAMLQDAMRTSASILTSLAKLDIEQAWVALEEAKAQMAFAAALGLAELPAERAALVRREFARRLRVFGEQERGADDKALSGIVIPPGR
jgi:hypothetical protein